MPILPHSFSLGILHCLLWDMRSQNNHVITHSSLKTRPVVFPMNPNFPGQDLLKVTARNIWALLCHCYTLINMLQFSSFTGRNEDTKTEMIVKDHTAFSTFLTSLLVAVGHERLEIYQKTKVIENRRLKLYCLIHPRVKHLPSTARLSSQLWVLSALG